MKQGPTGILIINLGTPDEPSRSAVYRYLKQFLLDPRVIDINPVSRNLLVRGIIAPFRSGQSAKLYKELWTEQGSPLKYHGENLASHCLLYTSQVPESLVECVRAVVGVGQTERSVILVLGHIHVGIDLIINVLLPGLGLSKKCQAE